MTDKVITYERTFSQTDSFIDAYGDEQFTIDIRRYDHKSIIPLFHLKELLEKYEHETFN